MFTGIVQKLLPITQIQHQQGLLKYAIHLEDQTNLKVGASIAIDGTCQTVVRIDGTNVWFDAIPETLEKTTLKNLIVGQLVNMERAAKFGDEIGGHILSGHVYGTATLTNIHENQYTFQCPAEWMKYFFEKGFIAIDGASLTLVDVDGKGAFSVHLIPETLLRTTLGFKKTGALVNIEIDSQTQTIVECCTRISTQRRVVTHPRTHFQRKEAKAQRNAKNFKKVKKVKKVI